MGMLLIISFILLLMIGIIVRGVYMDTNSYRCKKGNHSVVKEYGYRQPTTREDWEILCCSRGDKVVTKKNCKHCNKILN